MNKFLYYQTPLVIAIVALVNGHGEGALWCASVFLAMAAMELYFKYIDPHILVQRQERNWYELQKDID